MPSVIEADQSLRGFLGELAETGQLVTVTERVDPVFELAAHLVALDPGPAVRFENVGDTAMPVVGNVLGHLDRVALALGVARAGIQERMLRAITSHSTPLPVKHAPCQDVAEDVDFATLPIPTFFERESGPYLTAGVIIARDPVTGAGNASFARVRPLGPARALVGIAPNHHLNQLARRAADGRLEIAVVLGAHPAVQLAACLYLGLGDDELEHVEPLLGAPLRTIRCRTVDLAVPAEAEIVLEGVLDVTSTVEEGEVSEFHGRYENYGPAATAEFTCLTRRHDAFLPVVLPGLHSEHVYLGAVAIAAGLRQVLRQAIPSVGEVAVTEGGGGRLAVVLALRDPKPGQARRAMFVCWGAVSLVKQITVVDDGIDVWNAVAVEAARVTCCRADRDIVIVPGVSADRSEPLERDGTVAKIGYDATAKAADRAEGFGIAAPPARILAAAREFHQARRQPLLDTEER
jgi:4-hydroxy-3-polyprenylbenzoate decarboxylase